MANSVESVNKSFTAQCQSAFCSYAKNHAIYAMLVGIVAAISVFIIFKLQIILDAFIITLISFAVIVMLLKVNKVSVNKFSQKA
jgi:flagellar biosynthesis component FlhA